MHSPPLMTTTPPQASSTGTASSTDTALVNETTLADATVLVAESALTYATDPTGRPETHPSPRTLTEIHATPPAAEPSTPASSSRRLRGTAAAFLFTKAVMATGRRSLFPYAPFLAERAGVPTSSVLHVLAAMNILAGLTPLATPALLGRTRHRNLLISCVLCMAGADPLHRHVGDNIESRLLAGLAKGHVGAHRRRTLRCCCDLRVHKSVSRRGLSKGPFTDPGVRRSLHYFF